MHPPASVKVLARLSAQIQYTVYCGVIAIIYSVVMLGGTPKLHKYVQQSGKD